MKVLNTQRSNQEFMLMTLTFGGVIAITPFAIIRFMHGEWLVGLVDALMIIGMGVIGVYVYITHNTKFTSVLLTVFGLSGMTIIIYLIGPSASFWAYPTMVGVYFILAPRLAIQLTLLAAVMLAPALINKMDVVPFIALSITLVINNLFAYMFAIRMQRQQDQMALLVRKDPLTGAGNRRALDEKLDEIVAVNKRSHQFASLVVFDVDNFKRVNDQYGHPVGDQVLIKLTELINSRIRETDCLYRFGGEEFVVVLMGAGKKSATTIAEQFRLLIESNTIIEGEVITISLGVAELIEGETVKSWFERSDKAMYRAKETGRNRVNVAA